MKNSFSFKNQHSLRGFAFKLTTLFMFLILGSCFFLNACVAPEGSKAVQKAEKDKNVKDLLKKDCEDKVNKCEKDKQDCEEVKSTCEKAISKCDDEKKKCEESIPSCNNNNNNNSNTTHNNNNNRVCNTQTAQKDCSDKQKKCYEEIQQKNKDSKEENKNSDSDPKKDETSDAESDAEVTVEDKENLQKVLAFAQTKIEFALEKVIAEKESKSNPPSEIKTFFDFAKNQIASKDLVLKKEEIKTEELAQTSKYLLTQKKTTENTAIYILTGFGDKSKEGSEILKTEFNSSDKTYTLTYNINKVSDFYKEINTAKFASPDPTIVCKIVWNSENGEASTLSCENVTYDLSGKISFYYFQKIEYDLSGIKVANADNDKIVLTADFYKYEQDSQGNFKKTTLDMQSLPVTFDQWNNK